MQDAIVMPVSNDYQDVVSAGERGAQVLDRALSGGAMGDEATPASESRRGLVPHCTTGERTV